MILPVAVLALQTGAKLRIEEGSSASNYTKAIDRLSKRAGLPDLRKRPLTGTDFEIRVWNYLELARNPLHGQILRRRAMSYSGFEVRQPADDRKLVVPTPLPIPKSGWPALWQGLAPLLTLRDDGSLPDDGVAVMDGETTIVEIALPGRYRVVSHSNPEAHTRRKDAVTLVRMLGLLRREFSK